MTEAEIKEIEKEVSEDIKMPEQRRRMILALIREVRVLQGTIELLQKGTFR